MTAQDNFATIWGDTARRKADATALLHGERRLSWRELDGRAAALASVLLGAGLRPRDRVAQYLYNCPEYLESAFASFKAGLVPVNTNYRYLEDELVHLWNDSDAAAVIFHSAFADRIAALRSRVPRIRAWICVRDGSTPCPSWAIDYEAAIEDGSPDVDLGERSGDDLWMLYTGGTTGRPKGVVWRQRDLIGYLLEGSPSAPKVDPGERDATPVHLSASPLMHGTGSFTSFQALSTGGCVVTLTERSFRAEEFLDTVQRATVTTVALVGDAFCRPILAALDEHPGRWSISSLAWIASSGVMWSADVKAALLRHHPGLTLIDSFASSEAVGIARSVSSGSTLPPTGIFTAGPNTRLLDDDGKVMRRGTGEIGRVAVSGYLPLEYHKDPRKTADTFLSREGIRYAVPGDYATLDADGTLRLLGRGAACINSGGEKIFAEEVEKTLISHPEVRDAAVVGVPDERFGERVVGIVQSAAGTELGQDALISHVKGSLAAYKAPKQVLFVHSLGRGPNGKIDYKALRTFASNAQERPSS